MGLLTNGTIALSLCAFSAAARASETSTAAPQGHCGWSAIPGALLGGAAGFWASYGVLRLGGNSEEDLNHAHDGRLVALMSGMGGGLVLGPMASCAAFDPEDHAVPRVTFILGGALLAGVGAGVGAHALTAPGVERSGGTTNEFYAGEGQGVLTAFAAGLAGVGGGIAGYYMHNALFGVQNASASRGALLPSVSMEGAGLRWVGAF